MYIQSQEIEIQQNFDEQNIYSSRSTVVLSNLNLKLRYIIAVPFTMTNTSTKAHVCCSPHFAQRFLAALVALCSIFLVVSSNNWLADAFGDTYEKIKIQLMIRATSLGWWSVVSLLSSACCALQLILNLMSVGCAGFNTVLGPVRPVFLSLAFCGQLFMWSQLKLDSQYPQAIKASMLTCIVSFMPEFLYVYNRVRGSSTAMATDSTGSSIGSSTGSSIGSSSASDKMIRIKLENMGCIACVNTITNVLKACSGVVHVHVRLDDGEADVSIRMNECDVDDMCEQVTAIGFPASVASESEEEEEEEEEGNQPKEANQHPTAVVQADLEKSSSNLSTTLWAVVAGLLSSSCCALQLGLNLLSTFNILHIGCAGFNKVLGPLRGLTRSTSIGWLSFLWYRHGSNPKQRRRLLISTVITLSLMFLPEILRSTGGPAVAPPTSNQVVLHFKVPNMGCEACESNVQKIIGRQNGVIDSAVDFDAGVAQIMIAKDWSFDVGTLEKQLTNAGYGLLVDSKDEVEDVMDVMQREEEEDGVSNDGKIATAETSVGKGTDEEEVCLECELEDLDW